MKKLRLIVILAVMISCCKVFSGCGNSDVNTVKNSTLGNFNTLTIGNALDKYKYFKSTDWRFLETENGKRIVEFKGIYGADKLCKNTEFKQLALVIQFTMRVKKGFDLSYIGVEGVLRNGKTRQTSLGSYEADKCLKKIYQNQNTIDSNAPLIIKFKLQCAKLFDKKPVFEILDDYKGFSSAKWTSKVVGYERITKFTGTVNQDQVRNFPGAKTVKVVYAPGNLSCVKEYAGGKTQNISIIMKNDPVWFSNAMKGIIANKDIASIFSTVNMFKNSEQYKDLVQTKIVTNPKVTVSKDNKYVIFAAECPVNKTARDAGVVKRILYMWWNVEMSFFFEPKKGSFENIYKDGHKVKISIYKPSSICSSIKSNSEIASYFDPYRLLMLSDEDNFIKKTVRCNAGQFYNLWRRKFVKSEKGRDYYEFTKDVNKNINFTFTKDFCLVELFVLVSIDENGENCKIHDVRFECKRKGKPFTIKCSASEESKADLPNPLYYLFSGVTLPEKWFIDKSTKRKW